MATSSTSLTGNVISFALTVGVTMTLTTWYNSRAITALTQEVKKAKEGMDSAAKDLRETSHKTQQTIQEAHKTAQTIQQMNAELKDQVKQIANMLIQGASALNTVDKSWREGNKELHTELNRQAGIVADLIKIEESIKSEDPEKTYLENTIREQEELIGRSSLVIQDLKAEIKVLQDDLRERDLKEQLKISKGNESPLGKRKSDSAHSTSKKHKK